MSSRDDFTLEVKQILAQRVGMRCSNPDCRKPTSGPRIDPQKAINIGVAAHITAASPRGMRYDSSLSREERKSLSNGIWLCQNCAKLIDDDEARYTVGVLYEWKKKAEDVALQEVATATTSEVYETLMGKLDPLVNTLEAEQKAQTVSKITYEIAGGLEPDQSNPIPDKVYKKHTSSGIIVNYMVRNKKLMLEAIYPDGKSLIVDIGLGSIEVHKLPYPNDEMIVEVDPQYILSEKKHLKPNGNTLVTIIGKWGMLVQKELDPGGKLVSYNIEHAKVHIPAPFKKIVVDGPRI